MSRRVRRRLDDDIVVDIVVVDIVVDIVVVDIVVVDILGMPRPRVFNSNTTCILPQLQCSPIVSVGKG